MAFSGFPDEAIRFYEGLIAENNRTYWLANKPVFESAVRAPMLALLDELADHGPFHVFRPNKDVRFSKDKTPYKDHIAAYGESEGGAGFYVQFSATGMIAGSGYYHMAADQLDRFRAALDSDAVGGEIAAITERLGKGGLGVLGHRIVEDRTARLREGSSADRLAATEGPRRYSSMEAGEVDADEGRRAASARHMGSRRTDERLARCPCRSIDHSTRRRRDRPLRPL